MKRNCLACKTEFTTNNKQMIFCTAKCRNNYHWQLLKNKKPEKSKKGFFNWKEYGQGIII